MSKHRMVGEAILDYRTGDLWLDGNRLPYYLDVGPEVETDPEGAIVYIRVGIMSDRVTVVSTGSEAVSVETDQAPDLHADDLAWARVEARRIVREGLRRWITA